MLNNIVTLKSMLGVTTLFNAK